MNYQRVTEPELIKEKPKRLLFKAVEIFLYFLAVCAKNLKNGCAP